MSESSERPSTKDYTLVPTQERIDDDVDTPKSANERDEDEEGLYTSEASAPLLSGRSRENESHVQHSATVWYQRLPKWDLRWIQSRRNRNHRTWDAPSKPRNWCRIVLMTIVGCLCATILGLSISTAVLAQKLEHVWDQCGRTIVVPYHPPGSRMPLNKDWESWNGNLDFPSVYPPLDASASPSCKAAWATMRPIPCHEKLWNRAWDDGRPNSIFDPDMGLYAQKLCSTDCQNKIFYSYPAIISQCTKDDKFDWSHYQGPFLADADIEDGPLGVLETITRRLRHTCRTDPAIGIPNYYDEQYCTTILWEDWLIVDGMNAGNLNGLKNFERITSYRHSDTNERASRLGKDKCSDVSEYTYRRKERRDFGPGVNETTCGWCVMNWFERKLLSWEEGKIVDPETKRVVGLKEYLRRIQRLGQRCEGDAWARTWDRAMKKFKKELEGEKKKKVDVQKDDWEVITWENEAGEWEVGTLLEAIEEESNLEVKRE